MDDRLRVAVREVVFVAEPADLLLEVEESRAFFDHRAVTPEALVAFRAGWREVHEAARAAAGRIEELLRARLEEDPPLVVGTEAYRRAFLPLDVADLLDRIALDPGEACELCF